MYTLQTTHEQNGVFYKTFNQKPSKKELIKILNLATKEEINKIFDGQKVEIKNDYIKALLYEYN